MTDTAITKAIHHLRRVDPMMKALIKTHGEIPMTCLPNTFEMLARIIIGQQLSGKAADTIFARIRATAGGGRLTANRLASCSDTQLQKAGASRPKIRALRSLTEHVQTRKLQVSRLATLSDEAVFEKIIQVKGMGPWSAQMYLMFVLARPDIFPENDLGIRKAIVQHYGAELSPDSLEKIVACWSPYRTIASLYLWRSLNNRP
ncbi:MAG: DNA-3-methyladenine glycosylase 2 family protein [candidate division Zixibacteria bacterium]|nr:DNA-3-methyladenine glycosylase 2 family protein [candidate division Zixibacteria bacterium]